MVKVGNSSWFDFYFNASAETIQKAKALRKEMTPAEKRLWEILRARRFHGLKFRRQHPIESFIVDFYCPELKLIIEVDGLIHFTEENIEYDLNRTFEIEKYGLTIIRFTNDKVINETSAVLQHILSEVIKRR